MQVRKGDRELYIDKKMASHSDNKKNRAHYLYTTTVISTNISAECIYISTEFCGVKTKIKTDAIWNTMTKSREDLELAENKTP